MHSEYAEPDVPDVVVTDHPERGEFQLTVDGALAGVATYVQVGPDLDFVHTQIDDAFAGQGLGSTLIEAALGTARERGAGVLPHCPFVQRYVAQHPGYLALVPANRRGEFSLPD